MRVSRTTQSEHGFFIGFFFLWRDKQENISSVGKRTRQMPRRIARNTEARKSSPSIRVYRIAFLE